MFGVYTNFRVYIVLLSASCGIILLLAIGMLKKRQHLSLNSLYNFEEITSELRSRFDYTCSSIGTVSVEHFTSRSETEAKFQAFVFDLFNFPEQWTEEYTFEGHTGTFTVKTTFNANEVSFVEVVSDARSLAPARFWFEKFKNKWPALKIALKERNQ